MRASMRRGFRRGIKPHAPPIYQTSGFEYPVARRGGGGRARRASTSTRATPIRRRIGWRTRSPSWRWPRTRASSRRGWARSRRRCSAYVGAGGHVVSIEGLYGVSHAFITEHLPRFGATHTLATAATRRGDRRGHPARDARGARRVDHQPALARGRPRRDRGGVSRARRAARRRRHLRDAALAAADRARRDLERALGDQVHRAGTAICCSASSRGRRARWPRCASCASSPAATPIRSRRGWRCAGCARWRCAWSGRWRRRCGGARARARRRRRARLLSVAAVARRSRDRGARARRRRRHGQLRGRGRLDGRAALLRSAAAGRARGVASATSRR